MQAKSGDCHFIFVNNAVVLQVVHVNNNNIATSMELYNMSHNHQGYFSKRDHFCWK